MEHCQILTPEPVSCSPLSSLSRDRVRWVWATKPTKQEKQAHSSRTRSDRHILTLFFYSLAWFVHCYTVVLAFSKKKLRKYVWTIKHWFSILKMNLKLIFFLNKIFFRFFFEKFLKLNLKIIFKKNIFRFFEKAKNALCYSVVTPCLSMYQVPPACFYGRIPNAPFFVFFYFCFKYFFLFFDKYHSPKSMNISWHRLQMSSMLL